MDQPATNRPGEQSPAAKSASPSAVTPTPKPVAPIAPSLTTPVTRRTFISWLAFAWIAFTAAVATASTALVRYLFPNVLFEPPTTFKIGVPSEYAVGEVDERWKSKFSIWVVRTNEIIYALSTVCTHLGCTPNWLSTESKFKCPCHGSGFYKTGINFEGPAPRPLERFKIMLADDGQVLVDKGKKYQFEKGEWNNPESFIRL